jgi:hypothetical protein
MYISGKMRPAETIPEMKAGEVRRMMEGSEFNYGIWQEFLYMSQMYA